MTAIPFLKMHGCGNDFVVLDARVHEVGNIAENAAQIADRRFGVGCDQLIVIGHDHDADASMTIYNNDGSVAGMCGNAARCVLALLMEETGKDHVTLQVGERHLDGWKDRSVGLVTVDMGAPRLDAAGIPLAPGIPLAHDNPAQLDTGIENLPPAFCVSMGNPHAVFFVDDTAAITLHRLGPRVEHHPAFPERTNVEFAQVLDDSTIRVRVWERGSGETLACGSGACAVAVAAYHAKGMKGPVTIRMDGGDLRLELRERDGHVLLAGPVARVFEGRL